MRRTVGVVLLVASMPMLLIGWRATQPEADGIAPSVVVAPAGARDDDSAAATPLPRRRSLEAGPFALRWELSVPTLSIRAPIWSVGLTDARVMDAPIGEPDDAVWDTLFWYRGGVKPGMPGTATIAGHVSGGRGPSVFAELDALRAGDRLTFRDGEGRATRFEVTGRKTYPDTRSSDPRVLRRAFGVPAAEGRPARPGEEPFARLVLITCAGQLVGSTYDRRLLVFARLVR